MIWYIVRKKKEDEVILSKIDEVRAYAKMIKDHETVIAKQFLLDLDCIEDLVDSILIGDNEGNRGDNGINDGNRDNASISDSKDNDNNTLW